MKSPASVFEHSRLNLVPVAVPEQKDGESKEHFHARVVSWDASLSEWHRIRPIEKAPISLILSYVHSAF